ncbi:MAG TPA: HEAT repeat domain-containing protein, partial [Cytophagaceae bacterium]
MNGLKRLSEDKNAGYRDKMTLSSKQRLIIASRLASYSIFTNRNVFVRDSSLLDTFQISIDELVGETFRLENNNEEITLPKLNELFNCALFSTSGNNNYITWSHRSFQEFLAAWHITRLGIPSRQISLLIKSDDETNKLVPQLFETSKWLMRMNPGIYDELINSDPEFILRNHDVEVNKREKLVESLLSSASQYKHMDDYQDQDFYIKLKHENLSIQVEKYIANNGHNIIPRRIAIKLAGTCRIVEVAGSLYKIVIDTSNPVYLRKEAIEALGHINSYEFNQDLINLLENLVEGDEDDEIKGTLLEVLYPKYIDTGRMINYLTPRNRVNFSGSYRSFLRSVGSKIPNSDIKVAVESISNKEILWRGNMENDFKELIDILVERSWNSVFDSSLIKSFASLVMQLYNHNITFPIIEEVDKRRIIALEIINNLNEEDKTFNIWYRVSANNQRLLDNNDKEWLIYLLPNLRPKNKKVIVHLLWYLTDIYNYYHINQILEAATEHSEFYEILGNWLNPIEIDSIQAKILKDELINNRKHQDNARKRKEKLKSDSPRKKTLQLLQKSINGNLDAWWEMIFEMRRDPYLEYWSNHDFVFDIKKLPVWEQLDSERQKRIVLVGRRYIDEYKDIDTSWVFSNQYNRRELAGYKALILLAAEVNDPKWLEITKEIIEKWIPIILHCYLTPNKEKSHEENIIIRLIYEINEKECLFWIKNYLESILIADKEIYSFHLDDLNDFYCKELSDFCLSILAGRSLPANTQSSILNFIYKNEPLISIEFSLHHFRKFKIDTINGFKEDLGSSCTIFLISNPRQEFWSEIWDFIENNITIGKNLIEKAFYGLGYRRTDQLKSISHMDRAKLLFWLFQHYPPNEDPKHLGAYSPTQRDYISELRDQIRRDLIDEGTEVSYSALKWVAKKIDDPDSSLWWIYLAQEKKRNKSWTPIKLQELKILLKDSEKRMARSEIELMNILDESLGRLQARLKGTTPTASLLWNYCKDPKTGKNILNHKDENSLSDFVKMHLEYDLKDKRLIINREVEIKQSTGRKDGERIDILVQTHSEEGIPLTVVIETKGCWNPEINSALGDQLESRYLSEYKTKFGIYLIGWFYCAHFKAYKS